MIFLIKRRRNAHRRTVGDNMVSAMTPTVRKYRTVENNQRRFAYFGGVLKVILLLINNLIPAPVY